MTDFHSVVKEDPTGKAAKPRKKLLDLIPEDAAQKIGDDMHHAKATRKAKPAATPVETKKAEKRDGKLGYCENCMVTFGDFTEVRPY